MDDVRILAVADAYRARREKFAADLNAHYQEKELVKAHADFREILARPDIDAVIIAVHDNWHTPMAIAALKAGKDVYCQKPLALDFSHTKLLRNTVRESGRVFQFGTQWGNKSDHTSSIRYEGTGFVPQEGIFRTLATWDVNCDYENGVKLRLMDVETAAKAFAGMSEFGGVFNQPKYDGVIFMGTEGWISDAEGFRAQNRDIWRTKFKDDDEDFAPATEHNRNFIDCVKSRQEPMCPMEMAIRADTICHLSNAAAILKRPIQWNPQTEEIGKALK
jgi:hypothetical protein